MHVSIFTKIISYKTKLISPITKSFRTYITQYPVETEHGILAVINRIVVGDMKQCFRLEPPRELTLFISDAGATDEYDLKANSVMGRKTKDAWSLDVRGFGATQSTSLAGHDLDHPYGMDYMLATTYDMLGESLVGRRVHDALCVLDLLGETGARAITLVAKGNAAIIATLAGALHPKVKQLDLVSPAESFYEMTQKPISPALFSNVVPNFLKNFDWTDFIELV